jgi:hypothetical protein
MRHLAEDLKIHRTPRLGKHLAWGKTEQKEEGYDCEFFSLKFVYKYKWTISTS